MSETMDQLTEEALEACIRVAYNAGCPEEQVETFLDAGYVPLPWQWSFHAAAREADKPGGPVMIGAGGSRGPGKSHAIFAQITLDDMVRVPKLKALFLRQTGKAAKESFQDLVERVLGGKMGYELKGNVLRLANGSRAIIGGFKDEDDIDKYIGIEYDVIGIEELNQLTESKVTKLRGSLRTSKEGWRPRLYSSFNPGGKGHSFVKVTFIEPFRMEMEGETRFIPATYDENVHLNQEYTTYLESLGGQLGQAWREGNFDILAGTFFTEWNEELHVRETVEIKDEWRKWIEMDYGLAAPAAVFWNAIDENGKIYTYRELYGPGMTYSQVAEKIVENTPANEKIDYMVMDPACFSKDGRNNDKLAGNEIMERRFADLDFQPLRMVKGNNDRITGWSVMREYLRPIVGADGKREAQWIVTKDCPNLIRTMTMQIHDENGNPEDLDTTLEDHAVDAKRYGFMERPAPKKTSSQKEDELFRMAMAKKKGMPLRKMVRGVYRARPAGDKPRRLFVR